MRPTGELGIYVHFPYCRARCPYCDFRVDVVREIPGRAYLEAVLAELAGRAWGVDDEHRRLRSIYFGGGTPSLWEAEAIARIIDAATQTYRTAEAELEITVEANPRELTVERASRLRQAGVNRLSLGIQSFDDEALRRLGRDHDAAAGRRALEAALGAGFRRLSFDLIAAVPGRDLVDWQRELAAAEPFLEAGHLSVYELTVHKGTHFGRLRDQGRLVPVDDELAEAVLRETESFLEARGLVHYEVSNYARPGHEAVHNGLYWAGAEYLGLGVGAHSLRVGPDLVRRWENVRQTARYLEEPLAPPQAEERLDAVTHLKERVFLGLRTLAGVALDALAEQLEVPIPDDVIAGLARCLARGWLEEGEGRWRPTPEGLRFADAVALEVV
jgi:putative oxygen-independent coproporphyrinogen III oxidase